MDRRLGGFTPQQPPAPHPLWMAYLKGELPTPFDIFFTGLWLGVVVGAATGAMVGAIFKVWG